MQEVAVLIQLDLVPEPVRRLRSSGVVQGQRWDRLVFEVSGRNNLINESRPPPRSWNTNLPREMQNSQSNNLVRPCNTKSLLTLTLGERPLSDV